MRLFEIRPDEGGCLVTIEDEKDAAGGQERGFLSEGPNLRKLKATLGKLALELVEALEPAKANTKEISIDLALELTNSFDLKIVDLHSAAKLKVSIKI